MRHTRILLTLMTALVLTSGAVAEESTKSAVQTTPAPTMEGRADNYDSTLGQTATPSCGVESVVAESLGVQNLSAEMGGPPCEFCGTDEDCEEWGERFCSSVQGAFCGSGQWSCGSTRPVCHCVQ